MHKSLLPLLVDPAARTPLRLEVDIERDGMVVEGRLIGPDPRPYAIRYGIPRFVRTAEGDQKQTERSFGFKWQQRSTYDSPEFRAFFGPWQARRYGFDDVPSMREYFRGRRLVLDAGCGGGFSGAIWMTGDLGRVTWVGADISEAVDVAQDRLGAFDRTHFVQADVLGLPFPNGAFDTIFSEGVLHHTPSTEAALKSLVPLLEPGGEILFYVYRKKGPVREFTDDHVRSVLSTMPPNEAWAATRPLTRLAQALAELKAEVVVPEDVPCLGLKAGRQDVQRLIYWNFAKLFWNEDLGFEENNHVNFDWYHPRFAHRQTEDDVRRWCAESGLAVTRFHAEESGYTVRATRG